MNNLPKQYIQAFISFMCMSVFVFSCQAMAEIPSKNSDKKSDAAAQNLVNRLSLMSGLSGDFKQTIYDQNREEIQTTEGQFALERPGNLWWETAPPFDQLVVSNGEKLWVYDPDLEQVTIYPKEKIQNGPASILNGNLGSVRARYNVAERLDSIQTDVDKKKISGSIYTLTPKTAGSENFDTIVLAFHELNIKQVSMTDKLGQTTQIDFVDVQKNPEIAADRFVFTPPKGTDIVLDSE